MPSRDDLKPGAGEHAKRVCTRCGQANAPDDAWCISCGSALPPPTQAAATVPPGQRCAACEAPLELDDEFCPHCGGRTAGSVPQGQETALPLEARPTVPSIPPRAAAPVAPSEPLAVPPPFVGADAPAARPNVKRARRPPPAVVAAGLLLALGVAFAAGYAAVRFGLGPFRTHDKPELASPDAAQASSGSSAVAEERPKATTPTLATPDPVPAQPVVPVPEAASSEATALPPSTAPPPPGRAGRQTSRSAKSAVPGAPPRRLATPESGGASRKPPGPVRVGGAIQPPTKIKHVAPAYPALAKSAGIEGVVIIEATIGVDGLVNDAKVLRSIALLDRAALDAVNQWRYSPTRLNGVPVPVVMTVSVSFSLR